MFVVLVCPVKRFFMYITHGLFQEVHVYLTQRCRLVNISLCLSLPSLLPSLPPSNSTEHSGFLAVPFTKCGIVVVALGYDLAPKGEQLSFKSGCICLSSGLYIGVVPSQYPFMHTCYDE